jgi:hypothetical protein
MRPLLWIVMAALAGCSEYDLLSDDDPNGDVDSDDTVDPDSDQTYTDECPDQVFPGYVTSVDADCENEPETGTFTPVVEWAMPNFPTYSGANQAMSQPIVVQLTDDNADGVVDTDDMPDVVVATYGDVSGVVIRAIAGDGSAQLWATNLDMGEGQGGIAAADIDHDGLVEIAVVQYGGGIIVLENDGSVKYTSAQAPGSVQGAADTVAISDMDGDGNAEIIAGSAIFNADGSLRGQGRFGYGGSPTGNAGSCSFAVDLDRDGTEEVVVGNALYRPDGTAIWHNSGMDGYPAVGNFDADPEGEIVLGGGGVLRLLDTDGTELWNVPVPGATWNVYGGPPTVADFDGDGEPEIGIATGSRYSVFEKDGSILWQMPTQDATSGNTGSSVFDFEGDGAAEVVYADETTLWVFDGATGAVKLQSTEHGNNTWLEYPTIADIDGDGHAEIVVANTAYWGAYTQTNYSGVTVFGDADDSWRPGRKIWNEYAYHITNVNDDGSIPRVADVNWDTFNNFRSGDMLAGSGFASVDLTIAEADICEAECDVDTLVVWVNVGNSGAADLDVAASRGFVDLVAVIDGQEQPIDSVPINGGTVVHGTYQDSIQFDITGHDPAEFESVIVRVRSQERDCNVANNEVRWEGPFCQ